MSSADTFTQLQDVGILGMFHNILPFAIIFAIIYVPLRLLENKIKPFSKDIKKNRLRSLWIALGVAFFVIIPHILAYYPPEHDIVNIINYFLPNFSILVIPILLLSGWVIWRYSIDPQRSPSLAGIIIPLAYGFIFVLIRQFYTITIGYVDGVAVSITLAQSSKLCGLVLGGCDIIIRLYLFVWCAIALMVILVIVQIVRYIKIQPKKV